jgi:hypothetical protein
LQQITGNASTSLTLPVYHLSHKPALSAGSPFSK